MTLRERAARWLAPGASDKDKAEWAMKSFAGDRMTANELVAAIWGPTSTSSRWGTDALLQAYNDLPWLRATVGRIAEKVSSVPWQLFVASRTDGSKHARTKTSVRRRDIARSLDPNYRIQAYKALRNRDELREITEHPALRVLDDGNPRFAGPTCREVTQQHLDLVGEGIWVLEKNGLQVPLSTYPIPPTWVVMTPWTRPTQYLGHQPGNWIINTPSGTLHLPPEDVIYFYHPNPRDPYARGTGIGMALGDELETDESIAKHLMRWFKNHAIPPVIISRKGGTGGEGAAGAGKTNTERFEEKWMSKLLGRNNIPFFSSRELAVHELNQSFNDMQLSELRKDERDILIHVYGMPPEIFGILENSNRSTIDAADYLMGKYVIVPRLEFMRITLQKQLIEKFDKRLIIDYVSPVVEDKEFSLKVSQAHPYAFDVNELRELGGRPRLDGPSGEGFVVPINTTYVRTLEELGMPSDDDTDGEDDGPGDGDEEDADLPTS